MVLLTFPMNVVLLPFSYIAFCFVDIWNIPEHSSLHCFLFLATSSFPWSVPSFDIVLYALCLLVYGSPIEYFPWFFNCLAYKFFHPHKQSHLLPKINCLSFLILWLLLVLWYYFIVFLLVKWFLLPLDFFIVLLYLLLSVVLFRVILWIFVHPYCLLWY